MDRDPLAHIRREAASNLVGLVISLICIPIIGYMIFETDDGFLKVMGSIAVCGMAFGVVIFTALWINRPQKYTVELDYDQMNEVSSFCECNVKGKWRKYEPEAIGNRVDKCVFTFAKHSEAAMVKVFFKK